MFYPDKKTMASNPAYQIAGKVCGERFLFLGDLEQEDVKATLSTCHVVVFFTLTDRASTIPSNIRGCQSGTWSAGQEKISGTSTKLQLEHGNKTTQKQDENARTSCSSCYEVLRILCFGSNDDALLS